MNQKYNTLLYCGIFWVIDTLTDGVISDNSWELLSLKVLYGDTNNNEVTFTSKDGTTFNHENSWNELSKQHRFARQHSFQYYPRGRVGIHNNKCTIYLNANIHRDDIVDKIKIEFGLNDIQTKIFVDGSKHYNCFIDDKSIL